MTGNNLSQEEIEALMGMGNIENGSQNEEPLTNEEKDALGEIGNISFGNSATALSELLRNKTEMNTPTVTITSIEELKEEFSIPYVSVKVNYIEGIKGENALIIDMKDAAIIADLMMGGDGKNVNNENIGEMELSAVQEAMNQMMGKSATSMSMIFNRRVDISPPETEILDLHSDNVNEQLPNREPLVKISFQLRIGELIDSEVMMLLKLDFAKELASHLCSEDTNEPNTIEESSPIQTQPVVEAKPSIPQDNNVNKKSYQTATFADFAPTPSKEGGNSLDLLYDIPLNVTVELGRTERSVREILDLSNGSIIELDRLAGEHVDVLVNGKHIAKGEVVVIDENFGVRVTDILSPNERIKKLK